MPDGVPIARSGRVRIWVLRPRVLIGIGVALWCAFALILPHFVHISGTLPRTFNSMLDHLLRGQFDIDPAIIGKEGFARAGRVYSYWGPLPALLRLPITLVPGWRDLDFTIPYCTAALVLMGSVKVWTVRFVLRNSPEVPRPLARAMYLVITFSGAQICFLRFSVYQEVCLWAGLFGAIFVAAAIVAHHRGLGERERLVMAAAAGAALLTRVSTGIGLIAAFGLLLLVEAISNREQWRAQIRLSLRPLVVLALAGLVTAWVNYGRWGDPLTFADYRYYLFNLQYPDRVARTAGYGLFNVVRIPFALLYYFLPVWVLHGADGHLLFDATRLRLIDSAELPPSSFFLTDPLLLLLGGVALFGWLRRRKPGGMQGGAIAAGLVIPPLLMLTAISECFRYRMDFYPFIEFLAFSGLAMVGHESFAARPRLVWTLTIISILSSITIGIAYIVTKLGPAELLIGQGLGHYFLGRLGLL